jgi:hypothetical protein
MLSQKVSFKVLTSGDILSHSFLWQSNEGTPDCSVELPGNGEVVIGCDSVGKIAIDGDLQLVMDRSDANSRVFTWTRRARALGRDGEEATITIYHPDDDFEELTILVTRAEEASLTVEEYDEEDDEEFNFEIHFSSVSSFVKGFGAYLVIILAAIGGALFSRLLPEYSQELLFGSGFIVIYGYITTDSGDPFWKRLGFFAAAAVPLCYATYHPEHARNLLIIAGILSLCALTCDD